jgi:hypothetical protein
MSESARKPKLTKTESSTSTLLILTIMVATIWLIELFNHFYLDHHITLFDKIFDYALYPITVILGVIRYRRQRAAEKLSA